MTHGRTRRFRNNLRIERDNAALYARLAELADDPQLQHAYRRIAAGERGNAQFWEARLRELGEAVPRQRIGLRVRALSWFARRFGTEFVMPTVVRLAHADHEATPVDRSGHRDHFPLPRPAGPHGLRHRAQSGNTLRAAVLGANDGVISTASLMIGVSASGAAPGAVMTAGIAGLAAGAMSMAAGEYVSVQSQADTERADIAKEARELETQHDLERAELAGIYRRRGLDAALAQQVADQLMAKDALGAHVRDELGITETLRARPIQAALASAASFAAGAMIPVLATVAVPDRPAVTIGTTVAALFLLGAVAAGAGGSSPLKGSLRVAFWGGLAMGITALVGRLFHIAA